MFPNVSEIKPQLLVKSVNYNNKLKFVEKRNHRSDISNISSSIKVLQSTKNTVRKNVGIKRTIHHTDSSSISSRNRGKKHYVKPTYSQYN